ncbi:hypothetical protein [Bacillus atrophaeus]|uniref:hypothetical protein n=1 Tax=Bacillus atrophaeus TaxID=1452 RepID=UPI002282ADB4|nr:hypothetical protein [Bacillus atrophaeus]MCY8826385.1 hypothetical protein [Bacillus atrophaeus]MCY8841767.1 hypothetical protein [Bacillus atrophaeus]MCY8973356.1 hypothetical protein [Bacillus atrophaeus]MCY9134649.1 hypothetical protein [Bacillus atrophaeus]MEC0806501.1 hypothetical protein [Bacillus atrophaeus]
MNQLRISIEELIFCFYSEGFFEQGMAMKQNYFPDMEDEQLGFLFEGACRSLLAKEVAEYRNHQYRLKEEYRPFIHVLNDADYTVKMSKFDEQNGNELNFSCHVSKSGIYSHEVIHEQQVHRIMTIASKEELYAKASEFLHIIESVEQSGPVLTLTSEEFEQLLEGVSENQSRMMEFLDKHGNREGVSQFVQDLSLRKGKMDTMMHLLYDKDNTPEVAKMAFVIPGNRFTWLVTGITQNEFSIVPAHKNDVKEIIFEKNINLNS